MDVAQEGCQTGSEPRLARMIAILIAWAEAKSLDGGQIAPPFRYLNDERMPCGAMINFSLKCETADHQFESLFKICRRL